ncbi:hypothetical protein PNEG_02187 [Pneumocystis murina B123]|uniref:Uncharacterized protein n=1 Tax=Pneumocystis murina (strain B123) TaxID=1069680 RepID=M7PGL7_PNEMU|nr:hypothetical protein PNEG_02187 [Pneumocystis murina B123]EMR09604.1 hypothetical protein PNEG_02187 [Pneumocystis murina B123]
MFYWDTKKYNNKDNTEENHSYESNKSLSHSKLLSQTPKTPSATNWVLQAFRDHFFYVIYSGKKTYLKENNNTLCKDQFNSSIKTDFITKTRPIDTLKTIDNKKSDIEKIEHTSVDKKECKENIQISDIKTPKRQNSILRPPGTNGTRKTVSFYDVYEHDNGTYDSEENKTYFFRKFPGKFPSPYLSKSKNFEADKTCANTIFSSDFKAIASNSKKSPTNILYQQINSITQNNQKLRLLISEISEETSIFHDHLENNTSKFNITDNIKDHLSSGKYWKTKFETLNILKKNLENENQFWKSKCFHLEKQLQKLSKIDLMHSKKNDVGNDLFIKESRRESLSGNSFPENILENIKNDLIDDIGDIKIQTIEKPNIHLVTQNSDKNIQIENSEKEFCNLKTSLNNACYLFKNNDNKHPKVNINMNHREINKNKKSMKELNTKNDFSNYQKKCKDPDTIIFNCDTSDKKIKNKKTINQNFTELSTKKGDSRNDNSDTFKKDILDKNSNFSKSITNNTYHFKNSQQLQEIINEIPENLQYPTKPFSNVLDPISRKAAAAKRLEERRKNKDKVDKIKQNNLEKENINHFST